MLTAVSVISKLLFCAWPTETVGLPTYSQVMLGLGSDVFLKAKQSFKSFSESLGFTVRVEVC